MSLTLRAPAKVNLTLRVGPPEGEYHPVDSIVQAIPGDVLHAEPAERDSLEITGPHAAGLEADATNLVLRSLQALRGVGHDVPGVRFILEKHIPPAAGLGGGSGDAAAALVAAQMLFDLDADLVEIGAAVGSDVPALVRGGTVRMTGRGEIVEPYPFVGRFGVLVFVPSFGLGTVDVYRRFDALGFPHGHEVFLVPSALEVLIPLQNDLTPAAESLDPRVTKYLAVLSSAIGRPAMLSGSGSAMFGCFPTIGEAELAAELARPRLGELDPGFRLLQAFEPMPTGPAPVEGG
jgi:4-diphosphocytidyl-2-C-methyl-D-erythritol kinase